MSNLLAMRWLSVVGRYKKEAMEERAKRLRAEDQLKSYEEQLRQVSGAVVQSHEGLQRLIRIHNNNQRK